MPVGPTVSVVIPVRDDAVPLAACLEALAAQTRPAEEIVVVDNASSDDSADIARAAGARVVFCGERGIPAAAAAGYDAATGEVILRLDADSLPAPGWIAHMTAALSDQLKQNMLAHIPLKRFGKPEDVAAAVKFLASEEAGYITGAVLNVNGGMYM